MNLKNATSLLSLMIDADIPAMLWGAPGIGKSAVVKQIAQARHWNVIDFRASTRDPVALMGLPDLSAETTKWKAPDEFPQVERDGAEGILFLDEINTAAPSMQAAMFGLVLDRKVGEYTLPPGWRVIAAGNRQSDRAAAQRMPSALSNRLAHIDIDPDLDTAVDHFNRIGITPILTAFLRWRPGLLHDMQGDSPRAFPTPRSWEQVSKVLTNLLSASDGPMRLQAVTAIVGEGAAAEIEGFIRTYQSLPSLDKILSDPKGTPVPGDAAARYAVSAALARKVTTGTFDKAITYIDRIPAREFSVMFVIDACRREPKLVETKAFVEWNTAHADIVFG